MINQLGLFWGKTDKEGNWNPLMLHLIDVASTAEAILYREPFSTRQRMAEILDLEWDQAKPWLLFIIACHDLGKACPGFQCKEFGPIHVREMGLKIPGGVNLKVHHGFVSQIALKDFLIENDWSFELADKVADAVGCHHGERATPSHLKHLEGDRKSLGNKDWDEARKEICRVLLELFQVKQSPKKTQLSGPDFMLLSGLTSFADWIGENAPSEELPLEVREAVLTIKDCLDSDRKLPDICMEVVNDLLLK